MTHASVRLWQDKVQKGLGRERQSEVPTIPVRRAGSASAKVKDKAIGPY